MWEPEMSKQQKSNPDCELEPIKTKLPLGLKKAVTEAALPLILETMGVDRSEQERLLKDIGSQPTTDKMGSQRHRVWAKSELMVLQFEQRLRNLIEESDVDKNGVIDKEEFTKIIMSSLKYDRNLAEEDELSGKDFRAAEVRARNEFRYFDENNDKFLDLKEMLEFFYNHVEVQAAEENIAQGLP